jgi:predicted secreted protein
MTTNVKGEEDWREEMRHWNSLHVDVRYLTPEKREELEEKLDRESYERHKKGMENWTIRDWWEDYKWETLTSDLRNLEEVELHKQNLLKLRKRGKEIRDALAKRLAEVPKGEGITTKDLILESHKVIRILVECGYSDIYHPYALRFIHSQIKRITTKDWELYPGCETIQSLPIPITSGVASYAGITESTTIATALADVKRKKPTLTRAWVNCTHEQIKKVVELDYKRRMGIIKSMARFSERVDMPLNTEELEKQLIEKEPRSVWRDEMIKLIEEEKRKNPHNRKLEEEKDKQEREKWK